MQQRQEDNDEPVQGQVMIATKSDKRRSLIRVYLLLVGGAVVVGVIYLIARNTSGGGEETRLANDKLAEEISADKLRAAVDAGVRLLLEQDGRVNLKVAVRVSETPTVHDTVQAMREMKRHDGSLAEEFTPGNGHAADAGSPVITRCFALRAPLAAAPKNPVEDVQYLILRAYATEEAMREALKRLAPGDGRSKVQEAGRYTIAQFSKTYHGPAFDIIDDVLNCYVRGFYSVVPPPKGPLE